MKKYVLRTAITFLVVLPLFTVSCKKDNARHLPTDPVPISLSADQVSILSSDNTFAFDLFNRVVGNSGSPENIIISPLSISTALSMVMNGASGSTGDSMIAALRLSGLTAETINKAYRDLTAALLNVDQRVTISIANSVWTENNFVVKKPFTDVLTLYYSAQANAFDITDPLVPQKINSWIENNTNGLIKNMIGKLDPATVMLLANAIYFKGKWSSQFDKNNTVQETFYKSGGVEEQVPMMKQTSEFKIYNGSGFTMAEFPYGQGNFVMDLILPDDYDGINNILPLINESAMESWLSLMNERRTEITVPRFRYGFKKELKEILSDMGMKIAFSDNADFTNISDMGLKISFVLHQAFIETNEEGTEAAAATVAGIQTTAMPTEPYILNIDHPFLYIIRETSTNSILFMGRVDDPLAE